MTTEEPIVRNALRCRICCASADRYAWGYQCQANHYHVGDLNVGIFSDLTPPASKHEDKLGYTIQEARKLMEGVVSKPKTAYDIADAEAARFRREQTRIIKQGLSDLRAKYPSGIKTPEVSPTEHSLAFMGCDQLVQMVTGMPKWEWCGEPGRPKTRPKPEVKPKEFIPPTGPDARYVHCWYSPSQEAARATMSYVGEKFKANIYETKGSRKLIRVTEVTSSRRPNSGWDDQVYVGFGRYIRGCGQGPGDIQ